MNRLSFVAEEERMAIIICAVLVDVISLAYKNNKLIITSN